MTISFCKDCKNIRPPNSKKFTICQNCGLYQEILKDLVFQEKIKEKTKKGEGASTGENQYANYENICRRCGHDKAQIVDMGIFYSDEDNLIFLKCGKCGFSERIGRKVS